MKVIAIIQARLGSQRFPGKVLADLCGRPMLAHVVERVKAIKGLDQMVIAVPKADVKAVEATVSCWVTGSQRPDGDVLGRLWENAKYQAADVVVRITSDCPLLAPDLCERVIDAQAAHDAPYVWNVADGYVDGTDCEAMRMDVLEHAHVAATSGYDREHVTSWIRRHYPVLTVPPRGDYVRHKWSVDTEEDLARVSQIMQRTRGLMFADTLAAAAEAGL